MFKRRGGSNTNVPAIVPTITVMTLGTDSLGVMPVLSQEKANLFSRRNEYFPEEKGFKTSPSGWDI